MMSTAPASCRALIRGYDYFWFGLHHASSTPEASDLSAVSDGYISITPLHYDLTHYELLTTLEEGLAGAEAQNLKS